MCRSALRSRAVARLYDQALSLDATAAFPLEPRT
jgi:hypothetical protein